MTTVRLPRKDHAASTCTLTPLMQSERPDQNDQPLSAPRRTSTRKTSKQLVPSHLVVLAPTISRRANHYIINDWHCGTRRTKHRAAHHVEHIRVRLLNLVEEHDGVRPPPHCLRQLPTLVIPDVPCSTATSSIVKHLQCYPCIVTLNKHCEATQTLQRLKRKRESTRIKPYKTCIQPESPNDNLCCSAQAMTMPHSKSDRQDRNSMWASAHRAASR